MTTQNDPAAIPKLKSMLITFSAIDGAGKSTQVEQLKAYLQQQKCDPVCLWTRGGYTSWFNFLKEAVRCVARGKLPVSGPSQKRDAYFRKNWIQKFWLALAILDLARVYVIQVRFWLWHGNPVLCDRYVWDTLIDFKVSFPNVAVEKWWIWKSLVWLAPRPHIAFLFTISAEESERRCQVKYEPFPDSPSRRAERHRFYQKLDNLSIWRKIDGCQPVDRVFQEIVSEVTKAADSSRVVPGFQISN